MPPTPAVSINTLSLPPAPLEAHAEAVVRIGAAAISPDLTQDVQAVGVEQARRLLGDAGLAVAAVTHRAFGFATSQAAADARERLYASIEAAHALGAMAICMTTGGREGLAWGEAARRFAEAIAPCVERAAQAGVPLAVEPTSHLYTDASIAHRLTDLAALSEMSGVGVGIDLFACWFDSDIEAAIARAGPRIALVQVSDYVQGDRGLPCRAVPGDGAVPVDRLVGAILATGYRGPFDLEVIGPRLLAEGPEQGLRRGVTYLAAAIEAGLEASSASTAVPFTPPSP